MKVVTLKNNNQLLYTKIEKKIIPKFYVTGSETTDFFLFLLI